MSMSSFWLISIAGFVVSATIAWSIGYWRGRRTRSMSSDPIEHFGEVKSFADGWQHSVL